jgi:hypothetical protein
MPDGRLIPRPSEWIVPVGVDSDFTASYLLENGEKKAGSPDKFWIYDARTQSCQFFLKWIISGCGKLTGEVRSLKD